MANSAEPQEKRFFSQFEKLGFYGNDAVYLNAGAPGTELLRMLPPIIEAATSHLMQNELEGDAQIFQYGLENGHWQFRSFLATFLTEEYGDTVSSEQLFLTGGASSGLWLILSALFNSGSVVFVEDPSYFCALKVFSDLRMKVVPVKTDDYGIVTDDLQEKLIEHFSENPVAPHPPLKALIYLIPVYQNPTGSVLPEGRCRKLINLAQKYGVTIVCDDVYNLLHYDDKPVCPKRLFAYDNRFHPDYVGNVISNGTFSKFLGPGLRVGWIEAPKWATEMLEDFGVIGSGGGLNTYTSGVITSLMALGKMKIHLQKVKTVFKTHMEATADLLRQELPPGCKLKSPAKGGYFLWIELPENIDALQFLPFAKQEYQVAFMQGISASPSNSFANYIRICISFYPLDVLLSAVRRLCRAISDFQQRSEDDPNFWESYANSSKIDI
ncbi:Aromatic-amino-acid aminotransferase 1 [Araneus ventricosus]|uniref:Aromatic-amino-acid aminotransferase 1 n=1 Tax=Araneus ventricosus TaxID=182803 RepID=A0A4Y2JH55_ARAVE|nr:Aromatic-amino-acid aminotransferase 1 [Araneus ventricosus]